MLAKGKVYVSMEKLAEILSLPEGVEVIAVKPKGSAEEGFDFLVISAEETVCTKKNVPVGLLRRTSVETLEKFKTGNKGGIVASGQLTIENLNPEPKTVLLHKSETILTPKQIEQIMNGIKNIKIPEINKNGVKEDLQINVVIEQTEKDVKEIFDEIVKSVQKGIKK